MMKRLLFLIILILATSTFAQSPPLSEGAGGRLLSPSQAKQRIPAPRLQLTYESEQLYAFDSPHGFYLTPTHDDLPAILGYSDECDFSTACSNPTFSALLQQMERNLQKRSNSITIVPHVKPAGVKDEVPPLLHNLYHQEKPFNNFCPVIEGDTCVTGCVANAMAEVMNYWNWPVRGTGSHTYEDSLGCKQVLTSDFSAHTYDWDHILDDYEGAYTQRQADAVALLLSDCGISVDMRYGTGSSGASTIRQPIALTSYFGYDEGMQMLYRNFYRQLEWDSIMFTELSEGRPLIVSGWSSTLAHSFTCDGYDHDGLFHCNFGNPNGSGNAFLNFTFLSPNQPKWHDINSPEQGLNLLQTILVGMQPKRGETPSLQRFVYAFSHINTLSESPVEVAYNEPFDIVVHHLSNIGWNRHDGKVAIALVPYSAAQSSFGESLKDVSVVHVYDHPFALEELTDTTYTDTLSISLNEANIQLLGQGSGSSFRLLPVFEQNGTWQEARTMVGTPNYLLCEQKNGKLRISQPEQATARLVCEDFQFPDSVELLEKPHFSATFRNEGAEYSGRLYYVFVPKGSTNPDPFAGKVFSQEGLSIAAGATAHREYRFTPIWQMNAGEYTVRILSDVDLFTDSVNVLYDNPDHIIHVLPVGTTGIQATEYDPTENDQSVNGKSVNRKYTDLSGRPVASPQRRQILIRNRKKQLHTTE